MNPLVKHMNESCDSCVMTSIKDAWVTCHESSMWLNMSCMCHTHLTCDLCVIHTNASLTQISASCHIYECVMSRIRRRHLADMNAWYDANKDFTHKHIKAWHIIHRHQSYFWGPMSLPSISVVARNCIKCREKHDSFWARGKRRGFSPGAATLDRGRTRVPTDLYILFFLTLILASPFSFYFFQRFLRSDISSF